MRKRLPPAISQTDYDPLWEKLRAFCRRRPVIPEPEPEQFTLFGIEEPAKEKGIAFTVQDVKTQLDNLQKKLARKESP